MKKEGKREEDPNLGIFIKSRIHLTLLVIHVGHDILETPHRFQEPLKQHLNKRAIHTEVEFKYLTLDVSRLTSMTRQVFSPKPIRVIHHCLAYLFIF